MALASSSLYGGTNTPLFLFQWTPFSGEAVIHKACWCQWSFSSDHSITGSSRSRRLVQARKIMFFFFDMWIWKKRGKRQRKSEESQKGEDFRHIKGHMIEVRSMHPHSGDTQGYPSTAVHPAGALRSSLQLAPQLPEATPHWFSLKLFHILRINSHCQLPKKNI